MPDIRAEVVGADSAGDVHGILAAAYAGRPPLHPPSSFPSETVETMAAALARSGGLLCRAGAEVAGALLLEEAPGSLGLRRLGVLPAFRRRGVATALVARAEELAAERGYDDVTAEARTQLPGVQRFWAGRGYAELGRSTGRVRLGKALPARLVLPSPAATQEAGRRLAGVCRAGDVLVLTGELGAGKTTFTQGIGEGLGVRGGVTSPTFVISRLHPSQVGGPALLHVDAYRLGGEAELDDLDLDAYVDSAVTVVEWGEGVAEALAPDRQRVRLDRAAADDTRTLTAVPEGARWYGSGLRSAVLGAEGRSPSASQEPERRTASARG